MPIYEYTCKDCGHHFELLRSMKEADSPATCEHCQGEHTQRSLSVCYASSGGQPVAGTSCGCGSCSGGSCGSCHH